MRQAYQQLSNKRHELFVREFTATWDVRKACATIGIAERTAYRLFDRQDVRERIQGLHMALLKSADITAERVMLELARIAFADVRKIVDDEGKLLPLKDLDDDTAATLSGVEVETRFERDGTEVDLTTGEEKPRFVSVQTTKVRRVDKNPALSTLAKHFKLIGDEGDGVNALASALAARLDAAAKRAALPLEPLQEIEDARIPDKDLQRRP